MQPIVFLWAIEFIYKVDSEKKTSVRECKTPIQIVSLTPISSSQDTNTEKITTIKYQQFGQKPIITND